MSVDQFNAAFRQARKRVDPNNNIPASVIVATYKAALKPNIATQVYLRDPQNLADAENYARNAELALGATANVKTAKVAAIEALTAQIAALQAAQNPNNQPPPPRNYNNNNPRNYNNRNYNSNNNRRNNPTRPRFDPQKDTCYNCGQIGHMS